jgi:hypothetical protein
MLRDLLWRRCCTHTDGFPILLIIGSRQLQNPQAIRTQSPVRPAAG